MPTVNFRGRELDTAVEIKPHPESGYVLTTSMFVPRPVEEVFGFFADAGNLGTITPPWLNFKILTRMPLEMKQGALLEYRIRLRWIPIRWRTEITEWNPPHKFADCQRKGPYKTWLHEHTFESVDGGTMVGDRVHYVTPGGSLVNRLLVQSDLHRIFEFRQAKLREIFP